MLLKWAGKILDGSFTNKNLPFTRLDKLLKVMGDGLRGTEVFHVLGYLNAHFLAKAEEVINTVFARHDHCLEFIRANAVLAEFFFRDGLNMIERPPVYLDAIFLLNIVVW